MHREDTIAAISTPLGIGGIGVIRVSGEKAIRIIGQIFKAKNKQKLTAVASHTVHFGYIIGETSKGRKKPLNNIIDDVLVTIMRAPHSYTGEDVVEISCHGGLVILEKVLALILKRGAQLAAPGEFTKRAFLNGRLDLIQAEAVYDIINAKTDTSLEIAIGQLHGHLSSTVNKSRNKIVALVANLEAILDYPEEDIPSLLPDDVINDIEDILSLITELLHTAQSGRIFREGATLVIIGKPNTGKSTLLNTLLQEDKAIVTPIPGTTRDVIEDWLNIDGLPIKIMDTAGVKTPQDEVEHLGIERSKKAIELAELILIMIDVASPLNKEDEYIARLVAGKKYVVVGNKSDLRQVVKEKDIRRLFSKVNPDSPADYSLVNISALKGTGIKELNNLIYQSLTRGRISSSPSILVTNVRHKEALRRAAEALEEAKKTCKNKGSYEFIILDLRVALNAVGEITGEVANEDILEQIFSKFCVGK